MPMPAARTRLVSALLLVVAAACSDRATAPPAAPGNQVASSPLASRELHEPNARVTGRVASCSHRERRVGTGIIGSRGGILRVGTDYLVIPPGALESRTRIVATVVDGDAATISFEPHGLHFERPATLLLDAAGCDFAGREPALLYVDDEGSVLERIEGAYDPQSARLAAPIVHFSVYAVGV